MAGKVTIADIMKQQREKEAAVHTGTDSASRSASDETPAVVEAKPAHVTSRPQGAGKSILARLGGSNTDGATTVATSTVDESSSPEQVPESSLGETSAPAPFLSDGKPGLLERFERLEAMIVDGRYPKLQYALAKDYIAYIAKELATHPEYSDVLLPVNVHNIMLFLQQTSNAAYDSKVESKIKRETKSKKDSDWDDAFDFDAIDEALGVPLKESGGSLESLSALDTSAVKAKNR